MRLLRLEGDGLGGRAIDLHPEISIVTDLDDDLRARLLRACQALPAGEDPGCDGLVEAHGVLLDLSSSTLTMLGMTEPIDVVVSGEQPAEAEVDEEPSPFDVLSTAVTELRSVIGELDRAQLDVLSRLEAARADLDPFARTAFEQAQAAADRASGHVDVSRLLEEIEDPEPLRERLTELDRVQAELDNVDQDPIVEALEAAVALDHVDDAAVEAGRLAVELRQIDTELADLDSALTAQGLHPLELARRRDALSIDVARLESEHAPRDVPPDDRAAIETAYDAVVKAETKVGGSLLGGRNAETRLEEAVAELQTALDAVQLPTYSAYVMAVTIGSVDPELDNQLHEARRELASCQENFEAASQLLEHDPIRTTLLLRQEEISQRAGELLGRDPGPDVVGELLEYKEKRDETSSLDTLRHRLEQAGLVEPGTVPDDQVCDVASAWLETMVDAIESVDERAEERAGLVSRLEEIETAQAEADRLRQQAEDVEPSPELDAARARLDAHEAAAELVAELTGLLEDVDNRRHEIEAQLDAQEVLAELTRPGATPEPVAPSELEARASLRALFKDRLERHRNRSFAGSLPMVVSGVFRGDDRDRIGELLSELESLSEGVQLIILDDDLPVATWATSVGFERAAVVSPE